MIGTEMRSYAVEFGVHESVLYWIHLELVCALLGKSTNTGNVVISALEYNGRSLDLLVPLIHSHISY